MNALPFLARRSLAVALLVVALLSGWNLVLRPLYLAASRAVEELDDARFELQRLVLLAADAATTTPAAVRDEFDALHTDVFAGRSASDADARFVAAVDQLIRASGVRLLQLKTGAPARSGALTRHAVDITAAGHESDLARLLAAIEQHRPILVIDRAVLLSHGAPLVDAGSDVAPELSVELRVSGFGAELGAAESHGGANAR